MEKVQQEFERALDCLAKIATRRQRLEQTIANANAANAALEKKEEELMAYVESVKKIRSTLPDFNEGTNLPVYSDLPDEWFELEYDTMWELRRWFKGCIARDGCKRRQWCVIDVVKIFIEIFVEQNPGAIKLDHEHLRIYQYSWKTNDYVCHDTPESFRAATDKLGRFFNGLIRDYLEHVNREKKGHAALLHLKGIDVVAPYCAFNYRDYQEHRRDFVKPLKLYDDAKLVYLLNKSTDKFRKKFPRLYKIQNPQKKKPAVVVV